jgi:hypothetical protein
MIITLSALPILVTTCYSLSFTNTIKEKSDIELSIFYYPLASSTYHTPNAFDSDYTWTKKVKLRKADYRSIVKQIEASRFYCSDNLMRRSIKIFDSLTVHQLPGYWEDKGSNYNFYPSHEAWSEATEIVINKKERTLEMTLVHL